MGQAFQFFLFFHFLIVHDEGKACVSVLEVVREEKKIHTASGRTVQEQEMMSKTSNNFCAVFLGVKYML